MDHTDPVTTSMENDYRYIRALIKHYHFETDPMLKQELMQKIEEAKAKIDRMQMMIDCG